ncbi:ABC1 kinase family protein [Demetria terragena]|uniref:ABC1 kinase family protein n=1 Tax=Demetria terragena TaxID=63959 RepID=UPI00035C70FA|nr:AarF/UbiB family protein [Demetria terragena]
MTDLPRGAFRRSARLASIPLGIAGRAALGIGKRATGQPAAQVSAEMQARTAAQVFEVLGSLKGGALKFGQALSMFESAVPEELAEPYRATLVKMQEAAPPMAPETARATLRADLGDDWEQLFTEFSDEPAAAASIGQVHRAVWSDGREVAVKVQYPGAAKALISDLNQVTRVARVSAGWVPGLDLQPVLDELNGRMAEELDYHLEAYSQEQMADAYAGDPTICVPNVLMAAEHVIVSEWVEGRPLSDIIAHGTPAERNVAAERYLEFIISAPSRSGLLHADPHPGNFRMLEDGRLGVLDLGAVSRLPDGLPTALGELVTLALRDDADGVLEILREEGFVRSSIDVDAEDLLAYLGRFLEPLREDSFHFTRSWLRGIFAYINDPLGQDFAVGLRLNLPPQYLLIHRSWMGALAVLCQMDATASPRSIIDAHVPGAALPALD